MTLSACSGTQRLEILNKEVHVDTPPRLYPIEPPTGVHLNVVEWKILPCDNIDLHCTPGSFYYRLDRAGFESITDNLYKLLSWIEEAQWFMKNQLGEKSDATN